jgi:formylglycine-generating enzyme required for sulfatase activity
MVEIPGGSIKTFVIADPPEKKEIVKLSKFCLDKYEVTVQEYQACIDAKICTPARLEGEFANTSTLLEFDKDMKAKPEIGKTPVPSVTYKQARRYCANRKARLPKNAEWEWAASNLGTTDYPWGDKPESDYYSSKKYACGGNQSCAVGTSLLDVTKLGVFDLGSNISEWVDETLEGEVRSGMFTPPRYLTRGGSAMIGSRSANVRVPGSMVWQRFYAEDYPAKWWVGFRCAFDPT